jgi:hypothetical protein
MPDSRRTRMAVLAAAASGALVVTMAGTALAADHLDRPACSDLDLQEAALDAVAPAERIRLENLCGLTPIVRSDATEEADDGAPDTTPAAAPEEGSTDPAGDDGDTDRDCADFDSQADAQAAFEESSDDKERLDVAYARLVRVA